MEPSILDHVGDRAIYTPEQETRFRRCVSHDLNVSIVHGAVCARLELMTKVLLGHKAHEGEDVDEGGVDRQEGSANG